MKIVVCNKSGSVGKTTITAHLVARFLPNSNIYAVDPSNKTAAELGLKVKIFDPLQFKEMFEEIFRLEDAILDVGGSKIFEEFYQKMTETSHIHLEFDYFLVPSVPNDKAEKETVEVIIKLLEAGIPVDKIRIIFNKVEKLSKFAILPGFNEKTGIRFVTIPNSDLYGILADLGKTIDAVMADKKTANDYKRLALAEENGTEQYKIMFNNYYAKGMAESVSKQLSAAWDELELK